MAKIYSFTRLNSYIIRHHLRQIEDERKAKEKASRIIYGIGCLTLTAMLASIIAASYVVRARQPTLDEMNYAMRNMGSTGLHQLISEANCRPTDGRYLPPKSRIILKEYTIDNAVNECNYKIISRATDLGFDWRKIDLKMPKNIMQNYIKKHKKELF